MLNQIKVLDMKLNTLILKAFHMHSVAETPEPYICYLSLCLKHECNPKCFMESKKSIKKTFNRKSNKNRQKHK